MILGGGQEGTAYGPLSFNQLELLGRLYEAGRRRQGAPPTAICYALNLQGRLDVERLRGAVDTVFQRHEVFRAAVWAASSAGDEVVSKRTGFRQSLLRTCTTRMPWRHVHAEDASSPSLVGAVHTAVACRFDHGRPPFVRAILCELARLEHLLVLVVDHLVCDGVSFQVIRDEIETTYELGERASVALGPVVAQYGEFALWQRLRLRGDRLRSLREFWWSRWAGAGEDLVGESTLPFAAATKIARISGSVAVLECGVELSRRVTGCVRTVRVTPFTFFYVALALALRGLTGRQRVALIVYFANRVETRFRRVVGWCANTQIMGLEMGGACTGVELLRTASAAVAQAWERQELPVALLEGREGVPASRLPWTACPLAFDFRHETASTAGGLTVRRAVIRSAVRPRSLKIVGVEQSGTFSLEAHYCSERLQPRGVQALLRSIAVVLGAIATCPEETVANVCRQTASASHV